MNKFFSGIERQWTSIKFVAPKPMEYQTVYSAEIFEPSIRIVVTCVVIGVLIIAVHYAIKFYDRKRKEKAAHFFLDIELPWTSKEQSKLLLSLAVMIIAGGLLYYIAVNETRKKYELRLTSKETRSVEGKIKVLSTQPFNGHAKGDIIEIDGVKFMIDFYLESGRYYNTTISHGGLLRNGIDVRLTYLPREPEPEPDPFPYEWRILRIEYVKAQEDRLTK